MYAASKCYLLGNEACYRFQTLHFSFEIVRIFFISHVSITKMPPHDY